MGVTSNGIAACIFVFVVVFLLLVYFSQGLGLMNKGGVGGKSSTTPLTT